VETGPGATLETPEMRPARARCWVCLSPQAVAQEDQYVALPEGPVRMGKQRPIFGRRILFTRGLGKKRVYSAT
jgi:hypothetical protein